MSSSTSSPFISHITLEDLAAFAKNEFRDHDGTGKGSNTLMLQVASEARSRGYEGICVPLTNEKWKSRWRDLCLLVPNIEEDGEGAMKRQEMEQRGEAWRAKPGFGLDEVTITRLGGFSQYLYSSGDGIKQHILTGNG